MRPLLVLVAALVIVAVGASSAPAASLTCSTNGLRAQKTRDGVTLSVAVAKLRANGVNCKVARKVAKTAASKRLKTNAIPETIKGFAIEAVEQCDVCPNIDVTATAQAARITFELRGGA